MACTTLIILGPIQIVPNIWAITIYRGLSLLNASGDCRGKDWGCTSVPLLLGWRIHSMQRANHFVASTPPLTLLAFPICGMQNVTLLWNESIQEVNCYKSIPSPRLQDAHTPHLERPSSIPPFAPDHIQDTTLLSYPRLSQTIPSPKQRIRATDTPSHHIIHNPNKPFPFLYLPLLY